MILRCRMISLYIYIIYNMFIYIHIHTYIHIIYIYISYLHMYIYVHIYVFFLDESTLEKPGIQLSSVDELILPSDATPQILRADQVSNRAEGFAFCNQSLIIPKLEVRGGCYLLFIVPVVLRDDLRSELLEVPCRSSLLTILAAPDGDKHR